MDILGRMAADALLRQTLPFLPCMTGQAGSGSVLPGQRKAGLRVVERQRFLPIEYRMTTLAVSTQTAKMRVLLGMTGRTGCRSPAILVAISMTSNAGCFGMPTDQRVVGQIVIEAVLFERDQRKLATVMFAMTCFAGL